MPDLQTKPSASLKKRIINSSAWTLSGYAIAQGLRLVSNVIMAKLLFPEAFGLMTLVMVFMQGIAMFSDIGIKPSIVQSPDGDKAEFLNTAWTMQVIRGFILWLIALIGAYPYALIYHEPLLAWMLPIAGFSAIIAGFNSTSLATASRDLNLKIQTLIELISQAIALLVMVGWVYISPTVWGLVAGGLANALVKMVLSQFWLANQKNRLHWDKNHARSLFRFGRWIMVSTALTFFAKQIDRLLIGFFTSTATLGIYSIAVIFRDTATLAIQKLGGSVLFPSYAHLVRENDEKRLYRALKKTRILMISASWLGSLFLIIFGSKLIEWLYDDRYKSAIWMLQILPLAPLIEVLSMTYGNVFLAKGKSSYISALLFIQICLQITAITVGSMIEGIRGIVIGLVCVSWILYPANAIAAARLKIWQPEIDLPVIFMALTFVVIYLTYFYPL